MGRIEDALKSEIARLARKEIRAALTPMAAELRRLRRRVSELSEAAGTLAKRVKVTSHLLHAQSPQLTVSKEEAKTSRLSPGLIKKLRSRLGVSRAQLAGLVGVSTVAIQFWESGRTKPNQENRDAVIALRTRGRRDVQALLAEKQAEAPSPKRKSAQNTAPKKRTLRK